MSTTGSTKTTTGTIASARAVPRPAGKTKLRGGLRSMAASLFALAMILPGVAAPAHADGARSFEFSLEDRALQDEASGGGPGGTYDGLALSGTVHIVVKVGPGLTPDGKKTFSVHMNLQDVVASNGTISCRITGADSAQGIAEKRPSYSQEFKFSKSCPTTKQLIVGPNRLGFDSDGNLTNVILGVFRLQ